MEKLWTLWGLSCAELARLSVSPDVDAWALALAIALDIETDIEAARGAGGVWV